MTIVELLANEELRQKEFPVARSKVFLAHGGDCPLPQRVAKAIADYAQAAAGNDQETLIFPGALNDGRKLAARLLNCQEDEVAFVGPTSLALSFIAGQLAHAPAMTPILAPLVNSYKRLVPGYEAPVYISWGRTNRSALIRIPRSNIGRYRSTRCELRCPDPSANPYLAFAVMLAAGLDGIEKRLAPPPPAEENLYHVDGLRAGLSTLPANLGEAIAALEQDEVIQTALGQHVFERYIEAKKQEWDDYRLYVSQWELDRYLTVY